MKRQKQLQAYLDSVEVSGPDEPIIEDLIYFVTVQYRPSSPHEVWLIERIAMAELQCLRRERFNQQMQRGACLRRIERRVTKEIAENGGTDYQYQHMLELIKQARVDDSAFAELLLADAALDLASTESEARSDEMPELASAERLAAQSDEDRKGLYRELKDVQTRRRRDERASRAPHRRKASGRPR